MDEKTFQKKVAEHKKAKAEYRQEMVARDRAVHGEGSTVKYDPKTGSLKDGGNNG